MRKVVKLSNLSPEEAQIAPRHARHILTEPVPKYELPATGMDLDEVFPFYGRLFITAHSRWS